jgi:transposase
MAHGRRVLVEIIFFWQWRERVEGGMIELPASRPTCQQNVASRFKDASRLVVIPQRSDQIEREGGRKFDARTYKQRARIEQCVGWLKENRRVGTRYDKLATSFQAFIHLAIIRRYLRLLAPDDPSYRA